MSTVSASARTQPQLQSRSQCTAAEIRRAMAIAIALSSPAFFANAALAQDTAPSAAPAAGTGGVAGRVATSGNSLRGAIVKLVELGRSEVTGADGRFIMLGVPAGEYTLQATYVGFPAQEVKIVVKPGQTLEQAFSLVGSTEAEQAQQTQEIVVVGRKIVEGQMAAVNQQRTAKAIETVISDELFYQVNDGNIGTALQRLPGLSVDSDGSSQIPRYVNIRGVSTAFNSVQVDGQRLPTTGTGRGSEYGDTGRGFAIDDLPADAIKTVTVVKAPTPDMDGDALGGTLNLVTKSALERDGEHVDFNLGGTYNSLREETHPIGAVTYSNLLDLSGDRRLGFSITGSYYKTNEGFDNRDLDYNPLRPEDPLNFGLATQPTSAGGLDPRPITPGNPAATEGPGLFDEAANTIGERPYVENSRGPKEAIYYHEDTEYNNFIIDRDRIGLAANIEYELSPSTSVYLRPLFNTEQRVNDDRRYHKIMDNDHGDAGKAPYDPANPDDFYLSRRIVDGNAPGELVRLGADPDRRSTVDFVNENMGRATLDADGNPRGSVRYTGTYQTQDLTLTSLSFGGKHNFERSILNFDANISQAKKSQTGSQGIFTRNGFAFEYDRTDRFEARPDQYRVINNEYSYIPDVDEFAVVVDPTKADTLRASTVRSVDFDSEQNRYGVDVDFEREIDFGTLPVNGSWKTGVKLVQQDYTFDQTEQRYNLPSPSSDLYAQFPWAQFLLQNEFKVDQQPMPYYIDAQALRRYVEDPANQASGVVTVSDSNERTSVRNSTLSDYDATETVYAMYLMGTFEAGPMEVIGGVRWEHTEFEATRFAEDDDDGVFQATDLFQTTDKSNYDNLLPGILVNYELTDDLLLRGALTNTFARPQLVDLLNTRRVQDLDDPVEIEEGNPNLPPLESRNVDIALEYYLTNGFYSATLFRKDLTNFSFPAITIEENVAEFEGRDVQTITPLATGTARNEGLELAGYQRFSFLPYPLDGLYTNVSYTYTDSKANYPGRPETQLPTRGASRHLFAASLGWEWARLAASIQYRYRSPYIEGLAFADAQGENSFIEDDGFGESEYVDLNFSFRVIGDINVYANVTNLLNETFSSRQGYLDSPEDIYFDERRITAGVRGTFDL